MQPVTTILLALTFVAAVCAARDGCGCLYYGAQSSACNSDFVLRVRVKTTRIRPPVPGRPNAEPRRIYHVTVRDTFRALDGVRSLIKSNKMNITTFPQQCRPVALSRGGDYVLTGNIVHGKAVVGYCDFHKRWSALTPEEYKGLSGEYYSYCS